MGGQGRGEGGQEGREASAELVILSMVWSAGKPGAVTISVAAAEKMQRGEKAVV